MEDELREFCWKLRNVHPCQSMWCAKCYDSNDYIRFHVRVNPGFDDEEERFKGA